MAEYIDKQAAIEAVNSVPAADWVSKRYAEALKRIPPANVRPAGRWIPPRYPYIWYKATCSICGYEDPASYGGAEWKGKKWIPLNYCPNCGADMRGGDADSDEED